MPIPKNIHDLTNLAPRPGRRSKARALYDAITASGGVATLQEILDVLPATDDCTKWSTMTPEQVSKDLAPVVNSGYLVYNALERVWKIAPQSYYQNQQDHIRALRKKSDASLANRTDGSGYHFHTDETPHTLPRQSGITIRISPFWAGMITASLLYGIPALVYFLSP